MMTRTYFRRLELEPPPRLYVLMARGPWFRRVYRRFVTDLVASVPPNTRLLDVGTGPGYLLGCLARERPDLSLFGLDLSHTMVAGGRRRLRQWAPEARVHTVVGDAQELPLKGESFDHLLATFSFHIWQDPIRAASEIVRVLKPGGRAWIYEMNRDVNREQLREFAQEEKLPFLLVYLGFHSLAWNHALRAADFARVLEATAVPSWRLAPAHHLFWRVEIFKN